MKIRILNQNSKKCIFQTQKSLKARKYTTPIMAMELLI
jgi:hypothetical protein